MSKSTNSDKSIATRIKIKLQKKFGKSTYGNTWKEKNNKWYEEIHDSNYLLHNDFVNYLKEKKDIQTVLEVGCGTGIYPIKHKELFSNMQYTGIDISKTSIEHCRNNSEFEFICGDIIKMELPKKYDLVFSHAVVDHVYDIDGFISKIIQVCKKYAYINSYRGYFPNLEKHKMNWDGYNGCYFNDLSVKQTEQVLLKNGLEKDEFIVRSQESGQSEKNLSNQMVIEIHRKSR
jgi:SAM-dependent methyltransferase